jgi:hypothetical protein
MMASILSKKADDLYKHERDHLPSNQSTQHGRETTSKSYKAPETGKMATGAAAVVVVAGGLFVVCRLSSPL